MYIDTAGDYSMELAEFYENFWPRTSDYFQITPDVLERHLRAGSRAARRPAARGRSSRCRRPARISFGLTIVDENKRAIYYNAEFIDVVVKALAMKCRWQIRKFRTFAESVICFIDEPILSAFGSSTYVSVTREDVIAKLSEVVEAVHAEGALAGVHCCGNTEWSILIDAGVDIVNFDAFDYGETIALYPEAVKRHLEAGKALAWGIVPTNSAKIQAADAGCLVAKFDTLSDAPGEGGRYRSGIDRAAGADHPSCGTGSLPVADAERVFSVLQQTSQALRQRVAAIA